VLHDLGVLGARARVVVALSTAVGAVLIGACGGDSTGPAGCGESTVVSVSPGLEPTFSWPGGCRVRRVIVDQSSAPFQAMWDFTTSNEDQENVFGSPIQYGRLPTAGGASLRSGPLPLVAGRQYQVTLVAVGREEGCGGFVGCPPVLVVATFVP
jgi:hypothetical protein